MPVVVPVVEGTRRAKPLLGVVAVAVVVVAVAVAMVAVAMAAAVVVAEGEEKTAALPSLQVKHLQYLRALLMMREPVRLPQSTVALHRIPVGPKRSQSKQLFPPLQHPRAGWGGRPKRKRGSSPASCSPKWR